jgi:hypothetical protein
MKSEEKINMGGQYFPCMGEYLWGAVIIENLRSTL